MGDRPGMGDAKTPQKTDRRVAIILVVVGLLLCGVIVGALSPDDTSGDISGSVGAGTTEPPTADIPAGLRTTTALGTASPFDRGTFDAYWNGGIIAASIGYVTSVTWENGTLTAHTSLYPDADAVDPADKICRALAVYWSHVGQSFHPVRVLDHAGNVMTSRPTETDSCGWRR